jgi:hypothetical protein
MKNFIKQKLVEMTNEYNSLGVKIMYPSQILIIMRGVP